MALWIDFYHQYPDPDWASSCLDQAERIRTLIDRERQLHPYLPPEPANAVRQRRSAVPAHPEAESHYEWRGKRHHVGLSDLRDGIVNLASLGLIGTDQQQQDALRRGLGACSGHEERTQRAPWVYWLGDSDVLTLLIESLWRMDLIYCAGGQQMKWHTLRGVFLRADGTLFRPSIKSSRCHNADKAQMLREALLGRLHTLAYCGRPYGDWPIGSAS